MASFLTLHDKQFDAPELSPSSTKEFSESFLQAKLAGISDSLLKASSTSKELERVQQKLKALEAKDEEQSKKAMHLQAQVNSMQAIQKNTEKTLQHTASSKEAELSAVIDEQQTLIARLQASTTQVRDSSVFALVEEPLVLKSACWICAAEGEYGASRSRARVGSGRGTNQFVLLCGAQVLICFERFNSTD